MAITSATRIDQPHPIFPSSWEIARPEGALATEGTQDRPGVEEINSFTYLSIFVADVVAVSAAAGVAAGITSAITALVLVATLAATILRTAILILLLRILNLAAVAAGYALQHGAVFVETGNLDRGILQLVLHLHAGSKDDATNANQIGLHILQLLYRLTADAEAHGSQTWHRDGVALSGPRAKHFASSILLRKEGL